METDPFAALGLTDEASEADVRAARRRLAKQFHPDVGGDPANMRSLNDAVSAALRSIGDRVPHADTATPGPTPARDAAPATEDRVGRHTAPTREREWGVRRDTPSFTVEALPVEAFEGLLVATSILGEVLDDDPPYRLDTYLVAPLDCWCRLDILPDAGASTVSLTVAAPEGLRTPHVDDVRDAWVTTLNDLDWGRV